MLQFLTGLVSDLCESSSMFIILLDFVDVEKSPGCNIETRCTAVLLT